MFVEVGLCARMACLEWASRLSLAAEQSIEVGSRSMDVRVCTSWTISKKGMFRVGKWASPCCGTKHSSGVKKHGYGVFRSWTL